MTADDAPPPDPLRRLLDAVLAEEHAGVEDMAAGAYVSPFHFSRTVRSGSGESPRALRRRVELEQAAWRIQRGMSVTDAAFAAGYDSVEGFSRAFRRAYGHPPGRMPASGERGHWLPAPNGIHFHSPTALYVDAGEVHEHPAGDVVALMCEHDVHDIAVLLEAADGLTDADYRSIRLAGHRPRSFDGPEESIAAVLRHLVVSKEPWLASIVGTAEPDMGGPDDPSALLERHQRTGAAWLAMVRGTERRGGWQDRVVDALCEPPESFLLSQIVAHELTFSAHRRLLLRWMLADAGLDVSAPDMDPDPILWHRRRSGGEQ